MYRVFLPCLAAMTLAGCSMGSSVLSSGFAGPARSVAAARPSPESSLGGSSIKRPRRRASTKSRRRVASLGRNRGADNNFASTSTTNTRDFQSVKLDLERARSLINAYRKSKGLRILAVDVQLTDAAKKHSRDLARWDRISHFGSDGSNPWDRVKRAGYNAKLAAENVGTGQVSIDEVFKGWQKSPGHNKNLLLADADHMGLALVHDPKTEFKTFWTLVIGARL